MSDDAASILLYGIMILLPLSALVARRVPLGPTLKMAAAWVGIFLVGLVLVGQRDRFSGLLSGQQVSGRDVRIAQASDGHFYATVTLDGVERRLLVDSGATTTALSLATARAIGLDLDESPFPAIIGTANGSVQARTATVKHVKIGGIAMDDVGVVVSPAFGDTDVLGMNFLSRLSSWRVEGRTLVLSPEPS
ncbi:retropepsin-like aspartic protease family protein [Sphingomonas rubra]|uniref:Aspartyl protease family protein n=1 Tax=Sphingomonas rubra TaxID=634430 RepID=A0A1I5PYG8_9SPHN|nr:TIGR02281 family clan AA aspartic protease [Sphingomonas rubra]SFP38977.1 aspartyl protease family protein [Sphingomonas rubra]